MKAITEVDLHRMAKRHEAKKWITRQLSSGRRVVEKTRGELTARIYQGEGHWTAIINRAPREPFETSGELLRTSASTLAVTKAKASRALRQLAGRR